MQTKNLVPIVLIEVNADTQARVGLNRGRIKQYAKVIEESLGKKEPIPFPPVDLFFDGNSYFIGNGWHRVIAWTEFEIKTIPAIVHEGGMREARIFAAGSDGGLCRTNDDKRRSVDILLDDPECSKWSQGKIARHCSVTQQMVSKRIEARAKKPTTVVDPNGGAPTTVVVPTGGLEETNGHVSDDADLDEALADATESADVQLGEAEAEPKGPDIKALAEPYKKAQSDLNRIKRDMAKIGSDERLRGHLAVKLTRINGAIDELKEDIRGAEPVEVCQKCGGEGCQWCARTGFWTRRIQAQQKREGQPAEAAAS